MSEANTASRRLDSYGFGITNHPLKIATTIDNVEALLTLPPGSPRRFLPLFRKFPLVLVEWLDHTNGTNEWVDPSDELVVHHCFSIGWIVGEDDTVIKLVSHISADENDEDLQYSGPMKIVKSCIVRRLPINFVPARKK